MSAERENKSKTFNIFRNNCQQQVPIPPSQQTQSPIQVQKRGNHIAMQCIGHPKIVKEDSWKHKTVNRLGCNMQHAANGKM